MPELPEIRALAERLAAAVDGRTVTAFDVLGFSGLKTVSPAPQALLGRSVASVSADGKYVIIDLGGLRALIHLGNAGRLDLERPPKATRPRGALCRITFGDVAALVREHGTERRAGLWLLAPGDSGPLGALGYDPFSEEFATFVRTATDGRRLHGLLRDQRTVRGIGRGYADDILNAARLSPFATLAKLDADARERLLQSVRSVLAAAVDAERDRDGGLSESSLGDRFRVHRRAGQPCPQCGRRLERVSYATHEVVYCPDCQCGGKVLADRRLSRLLK